MEYRKHKSGSKLGVGGLRELWVVRDTLREVTRSDT